MVQRQAREPEPDHARPGLTRARALGGTQSVVLVLHGGKSVSRELTMTTQLAVLRMLPFAWGIRARTLHRHTAVWRLRYRYRGWNGSEASPVVDALWALEQVRERHGDVPVVLLGHSMGGRTAVHVADDPSVAGLVLLAPWLDAGEPTTSKPALVLHGLEDRMTSAVASRAWAARSGAQFEGVEGGEHFMLRRFPHWQRRAARAVVDLTRAAYV